MKNNISIEEAQKILTSLSHKVSTEEIPLFEAQGRVLAEDVKAIVNVPPFPRSPYDGYALRGEDTANASKRNPVTLKILEELPAGKAPTMPVTPGCATKILTGAPVPDGANAIVKFEETQFTAETVTFTSPVKPHTDIVPAGEDVAIGEILAKAGTVITPGVAGVMAGQGMATAKVFCKPRVFVMSTGSELLDPGMEPQPAKIYNSNVYSISAYLDAMGCKSTNGGSVDDDEAIIAEHIKTGVADYDMVVTTGGASVGDYDYAVRAAQHMGANVLFWKVEMKPGSSVVAAEKDGKLILSLSGNPAAALVSLLRVFSPYVKSLCGRTDCHFQCLQLPVKGEFRKKSTRRRIINGHIEYEHGRAVFVPYETQGNGVVSGFIGCDALAEVPAGTPPFGPGTILDVYKID